MRQPDYDTGAGRNDWWIARILKRTGRPDVLWFAKVVAERIAKEQQRGYSRFAAFGVRGTLSTWVRPIDAEVADREDVRQAVARLVEIGTQSDSGDYGLAPHLADVDPHGRLVPAEILRRIPEATGFEQLRRLARLAKAYGLDTPTWRSLSEPILQRARSWPEREKLGIFWALSEPSTGHWRRRFGEVSETHVRAVERMRAKLDGETVETLRELWEWALERAQRRLRDEEETAKEERGE
jgi:hypothetical protein